MAQHQVGNAQGVVDKQRATSRSVAKSNNSVTTPANYDNLAAMDARLKVINAAYYTDARLDSLTMNDKIYALRVHDDATTF
jgi:hypothetical protein